METVQTELRKRKDTDLFFMILQQQRESNQNICSSPRFGSKGLNPWHCNTVVVDVILLWEQKRLTETSQTGYGWLIIWLLVYGLTSTVTMFTGSLKKGYKRTTGEKLQKGTEPITFFILF